jgi:DNA processing protein
VDVVYPRENRGLYKRIRSEGCVLSEFPCGSFPAPQNFPVRNRIISGLSLGTVIVEASEFSGSLITARLTLEQDRELWAVPGNITGKGSYGPNYLIKQGAHVVLDVQDIIDELPVRVLNQLKTAVPEQEGAVDTEVSAAEISEGSRKVLGAVPVDRAVHFDQLLEGLEFSLAELNQMLLELEMNSLIRQLPGRRFSRRF